MSAGPLVEVPEEQPEAYDLDYLVPDPMVADILNEDLEVDIQGMIYKVTPYGTFVVPEEDYDKLAAILSEAGNDTGDLSSHRFYNKPVGNDLYEVGENILLKDSYLNTNIAERTPYELRLPIDEGVGVGSSSSTPNYNTAIQNGDYSSLPVIDFGRHTVVGKWIEAIKGTNEVYKAEFSSKNRVKVKLYNVDWIFHKSLGIKVTMQKKNWIGWSGTNAQEIRLGWDGISFTKEDNVTPANPWQPIKLAWPHMGNPEWDKTQPPFTKPDAIYTEIDLLGYPVNLDVSRSFQQGVKKLFDFAKTKLSVPPKNTMTNLIAWKTPSRDQTIVIAGPGEVSDKNTEWLHLNFARSTDVIVQFPTSTGRSAIVAAIIGTIMKSKNAVKINLDGASIYGVAKYGDKWLGARIDKK